MSVPGTARRVSPLFGVLFLIAAVICFISPEGTFAALADTLGFLFLIVGLWWMVRAFLERAANIWALMGGIGDIVRAFVVYRIHDEM